jgi:isocitrate dehydrogenase
MLEHPRWQEAADRIIKNLSSAIIAKTVTYDLARRMEGTTKISCSRFGEAIKSHA